MGIDLHAHSTASDGTESPAQVVHQAVAAGLTTLALTDHDTMHGWAEAARAARLSGIDLVPGIEISCARDGESIHLLGYLVDPENAALNEELAKARFSRVGRLEAMVARMVADGIPITYAQVLAQVPPGATPGRPHIADALVAAGVIEHRDEAFEDWLSNQSPYYVAHYAMDPVLAVQLVRGAGGVAVIAHPFTRSEDPVEQRTALIEQMAAAGMVGLEANHRDHAPQLREIAVSVATDLGLLVTGSSDYHGAGKLNRLGENVTEPVVLEQIEALATGVPVVRP